MKLTKTLAIAVTLVCAGITNSFAQDAGQPEADPRPIPRNAAGRVSFAGTPDQVGNWEGLLGTMANTNGPNRSNIPEALAYDQVPFQPWAKELHASRREGGGKDDPPHRASLSIGSISLLHHQDGAVVRFFHHLQKLLLQTSYCKEQMKLGIHD